METPAGREALVTFRLAELGDEAAIEGERKDGQSIWMEHNGLRHVNSMKSR